MVLRNTMLASRTQDRLMWRNSVLTKRWVSMRRHGSIGRGAPVVQIIPSTKKAQLYVLVPRSGLQRPPLHTL